MLRNTYTSYTLYLRALATEITHNTPFVWVSRLYGTLFLCVCWRFVHSKMSSIKEIKELHNKNYKYPFSEIYWN